MRMLLVTPSPANSLHFANSLGAQCGRAVMRAGDCEEALRKVARHNPGLVIVDESLRDLRPLEFIRQLLTKDAFVNVAVLSSLPADQFHEAYEGLGVLAQLPPRPGRKEAAELLAKYRRVAPAA